MVGLRFVEADTCDYGLLREVCHTVKDLVCGMDVEPSTAKHKLEYAGKTYYFCCASCLEKFRDPSG